MEYIRRVIEAEKYRKYSMLERVGQRLQNLFAHKPYKWVWTGNLSGKVLCHISFKLFRSNKKSLNWYVYLSVGWRLSCGVNKNAAIFDGSVDVCHHGTHISGIVRFAFGWIFFGLNILPHCWVPFAGVTFVYGVNFSSKIDKVD